MAYELPPELWLVILRIVEPTDGHFSGLMTVCRAWKDLCKLIQVEDIYIHEERSIHQFAHFIRSDRDPHRLGSCIRSLVLMDIWNSSREKASSEAWESAQYIVQHSSNLRVLEVERCYWAPIPPAFLSTVFQRSGLNLTSLSIPLSSESKTSLDRIGECKNLKELALCFRSIPALDYRNQAHLALPGVTRFQCNWFRKREENGTVTDFLRYLGRSRFQNNCEFYFVPSKLSATDSKELNPLFENHISSRVDFYSGFPNECFLDQASSIFFHSAVVDLGQMIVSPELFSSARLPDDVHIGVGSSDYTDEIDAIGKIVQKIVDSGHKHNMRLHIEYIPAKFSWEVNEDEYEDITSFRDEMFKFAFDLRECGVVIVDEDGYAFNINATRIC